VVLASLLKRSIDELKTALFVPFWIRFPRKKAAVPMDVPARPDELPALNEVWVSLQVRFRGPEGAAALFRSVAAEEKLASGQPFQRCSARLLACR
jgi:hypothetical protein